MKFRLKVVACLTLTLVIANSWRVEAQGEVDFKGKTIRIVIGTSTGGGVDLYARLMGQFLSKHLPGEAFIVAQNMPGASSVVAANYLYGQAKPDGLTLGALQGGTFFDRVLGRGTAKFDWPKLTWIGSPEEIVLNRSCFLLFKLCAFASWRENYPNLRALRVLRGE